MEEEQNQDPGPRTTSIFQLLPLKSTELDVHPQSAYTKFQAMPLSIQYKAHSSYYRKFKATCHQEEGTHQQCMETHCHFKSSFRVSEVNIQWALFYLYTKATGEVDKFSKPDKIQRDMFRLGGILFHKSRIVNGRRYMMSANMKSPWPPRTSTYLHQL